MFFLFWMKRSCFTTVDNSGNSLFSGYVFVTIYQLNKTQLFNKSNKIFYFLHLYRLKNDTYR